jgi:hypothetical protein
VKRVNDLEATIARLRAQISPEQLAAFDATLNQATAQPDSTQRQTVALIFCQFEDYF